jgi:hypothetical protein
MERTIKKTTKAEVTLTLSAKDVIFLKSLVHSFNKEDVKFRFLPEGQALMRNFPRNGWGSFGDDILYKCGIEDDVCAFLLDLSAFCSEIFNEVTVEELK